MSIFLRAFFLVVLMGGLCPYGGEVSACSCSWMGPFLTMAPHSPIIIRGMILDHLGQEKGNPSSMEVQVLEVFRGDLQERRVRVWGDLGWLCRPPVSKFPIGTEWILALNGPGSKPGVTPDGYAISVCGEFWLRVIQGKAVGNLDNAQDKNASLEIDLQELRGKLMNGCPEDRSRITFSARISAGEALVKDFGPGFTFHLVPNPYGWEIFIKDDRGTENIARLTPPFHSVPNPREIEGWHFRNADNSGPNEAGDKNINAPGEKREFIFSPAVGRTIGGPNAGRSPGREAIEAIRSFGRGTLTILRYQLADLEPGKQARFQWMEFEVELSWANSR